jgi:hypothetical protein
LVRQGSLYTRGGGFSGLELAKALLADLGFAAKERRVRKLLLLPPARKFQSPLFCSSDQRSARLATPGIRCLQ